MTRNKTLSAAISATLAQRRHAEAVQVLERTKQSGDTQAQSRAQARATAALHAYMRAEREARRHG